jgi:hypothetical protein
MSPPDLMRIEAILQLYALMKALAEAIKGSEVRVERDDRKMEVVVYIGGEKAVEARVYDKKLWSILTKYVFT